MTARFASTIFLNVWLVLAIASMTGCGFFPPDQSQFDDLDTLAATDQAVVRVCSEQFVLTPSMCYHSWILVKSADAHQFDRWELAGAYWGETGHVGKNATADLMQINYDFMDANILTEITGQQAQDVIDFIEQNATSYPSRNYFLLATGPNCNTFVQWVCNESGWGFQMPIGAFGANAEQVTPDIENHDVW